MKMLSTVASGAAVVFLMLSAPAFAQSQCPGGGRATQASCGNDTCSCAAPCTQGSQCQSGCCSGGFCALDCVCLGQGTVNVNCAGGGACACGGNTVAPTSTPLSNGMGMMFGFALMGLGLVTSARFMRKGGLRSPATMTALSLALLGGAFVTATAFEQPTTHPAKDLKAAVSQN